MRTRFYRFHLPLVATLIVSLAVACIQAGSRPAVTTVLGLAGGWQFRLDPEDRGLALGWERPETTFPADRTVQTGTSLADQGIPGYRGVSWYRRWVHVPASWSRVVIGFGAIDVACDLYVNGRWVGHYEDSLGERVARADLTELVPPARQALIVFRVVGAGGFGGIKQAVQLGPDESAVMTGLQYGLFLNDTHPDWRLPAWTRGQGRAWTVAGVERANVKAVIATDGTVSPWAGGYGISIWLYDRTAGQLVNFPEPTAGLRDGSSPMPVFVFRREPWTLREEVAAFGPPDAPAMAMRLTLEEGAGDAWLYAAVRPFSASGGIAPIVTAEVRGTSIWANGHLALRAPSAGGAGGALSEGDASTIASAASIPATTWARHPQGQAQALLRLSIRAGEPLTLLAPSARARGVSEAPDFEGLSQAWQQRLHQVQLELPDQRLQDAFYASLGYMLVNSRAGLIHPGPLIHDSFWVRDAAMIGYALERAGLADAVRASAGALLRSIGYDGSVTAITASDGKPRPEVELDAAGQAAFGLVEYGRFASDGGWLETAYPAMMRALRYTLDHRDAGGLLPPNLSAEDLGSAANHHYWDDFWLLTGLSQARWAAQQLGKPEDESWLAASFEEVRAALLASIAATGSSIIPNGPEDLDSPAMARGSTPALWPLAVLDPNDPLVQRSFAAYYQRFIQSEGGAYHHLYGHWWPYGGLEIAHALLLLGRRDEANHILDYTLSHQTAPGLFAWAEGVDPRTNSFAEGDMPHAWAAAELVNLVRDMLLYEDGDRLIVGAGIPRSWRGKHISIRGAPSYWGIVDLEISAGGEVHLSGAQPPGGIDVRLLD